MKSILGTNEFRKFSMCCFKGPLDHILYFPSTYNVNMRADEPTSSFKSIQLIIQLNIIFGNYRRGVSCSMVSKQYSSIDRSSYFIVKVGLKFNQHMYVERGVSMPHMLQSVNYEFILGHVTTIQYPLCKFG